jgi:hypothetical protein
MSYINLYTTENFIIPQKLLDLFILYEDEIVNQSNEFENNLELNETSEEYEILNIKKSEKTFNELLFEYIEKSNISDVELYKKAYIRSILIRTILIKNAP